jgi:hypothetical protein
MRHSLTVFAFLLALAASAMAQEAATLVRTTGHAELRRASEVMISPTAKNMAIRLPFTARVGETIAIQYQDDRAAVADSFVVTGISIKDDACTLESKRNTNPDAKLSDMIFAQPCQKLE